MDEDVSYIKMMLKWLTVGAWLNHRKKRFVFKFRKITEYTNQNKTDFSQILERTVMEYWSLPLYAIIAEIP